MNDAFLAFESGYRINFMASDEMLKELNSRLDSGDAIVGIEVFNTKDLEEK